MFMKSMLLLFFGDVNNPFLNELGEINLQSQYARIIVIVIIVLWPAFNIMLLCTGLFGLNKDAVTHLFIILVHEY